MSAGRRWRAAAAIAAVVVMAAGCRGTGGEGEQKAHASLQEIRAELKALVDQWGEDAYTQPEMDEVLGRLGEVDPESPDRIEAVKLADFIRAKRKLAYEIQVPDRPAGEPENAVQVGPRPMGGQAPVDAAKLQAAEKLGVGATRAQLTEAYGSCLVRQTWFLGANGGPSTELYQVVAGCRERLKPRIFTVANSVVIRVADGTIDQVMVNNPVPQDEMRRGPPGKATSGRP